uniref:Xanthine dehydrogenase n=1 Tax=Timema bartmani TaxID=61472 RepID=A0A7R9I5P8_9NEOP|nr:unnamed protein product [Timema bartmani]
MLKTPVLLFECAIHVLCQGTKNETTFTINDVSYSVAAEVPVETNLNTFIRDYAHLSGTKFMCEEGGCGSCIVYVRRKHPTTGAEATGVVNSVSSPLTLRGVGDHPTSLGRGNVGSRNHTDSLYAMLDPLTNHANYFFPREETLHEPARCSRGGLWEHWASDDCLVLVFSCHQWEITTVEGLGDRKKGYHPIQTTLANYNGTQCGYCTPGMVMNMYSLSRQGKGPTMAEMENSFGGNICRCTGYRSILDAFKTLCVDAPPKINNSCHDIEADHNSEGGCRIPVHILLDDAQWYRVSSVDEIFQVFAQIGEEPYQLVAGNTAHGKRGTRTRWGVVLLAMQTREVDFKGRVAASVWRENETILREGEKASVHPVKIRTPTLPFTDKTSSGDTNV